MTAVLIFLAVILAIVLIVAFIGISIYNRLIANRNEADNAFAQIDVQLTRRYDLIPNLINVAKKYMAHEQETLKAVVEARNQAKAALDSAKQSGEAQQLQALNAAEQHLQKQMGGFYAVFENYPDLKANTQMMQLSEELSSTENKVAFARQHFNDIVTTYNNSRQQFPNSIIAGMFNFQNKALLEIDNIETKREAVVVDFDN